MAEQGHIKVKYALLCDLVRREDNGKNILVGVYAADAQVKRFPAHLVIALYLCIDIEKAGKISIEVQVLDNEKVLLRGNAAVVSDKVAKDGAMAYPPMPLEVPAETTLVFQVKVNEGDWQTVRELPVKSRKA